MANRELIEKKLSLIAEYIGELLATVKFKNDEIKSDKPKLRAVERLLQMIVDTAIDINSHIISENKLADSDDYQGTFSILGDNKILPETFAKKIAQSVGLRNAVVHQYEKIDIDRMIDTVRNEIVDYREYIKFINNFLERQ